MRLNALQRARRKAAHWLPGRRVPLGLREGALSITFDDFPRTAWTQGGGVLAHHGVKATYYASGRFTGGEMDGQRGNILPAFSQGWHMDLDRIQTKEQVLAKLTGGTSRAEIGIGGRY